jgi:hypothetical protein
VSQEKNVMAKPKKAAKVEAEDSPAPAATFEDALRALETLAESLSDEVARRLAKHLADLVSVTTKNVIILPGDPGSVEVEDINWRNDSGLGMFANLLSIHMADRPPASDIRNALTKALAESRPPPRGPKKPRRIDEIRYLQGQGKTLRAIAKELGIEKESVRMARYRSRRRKPPPLVVATPPEKAPENRASC